MRKLHTLVENGDLRSVHLVVRGGVDINVQRQDGLNALMLACVNGHQDIVEYLLDKPEIDVTARNKRGQTLLHLCCLAKSEAAKQNSGAILDIVVPILAELEKKREDEESKTTASPKKQTTARSPTRKKGVADEEERGIDELDNNGRTALHYAVYVACYRILTLNFCLHFCLNRILSVRLQGQ